MEFKSVLDNVVFLDIETTGLDPMHSEIFEVGAIKIKDSIQTKFSKLIKPKGDIPISTYYLCDGLKEEELKLAPSLDLIKSELIEFLEDLPIICHNGRINNNFIKIHLPEIKNEILDSMELAAILEPWRHNFYLEELLNEMTTLNRKEKHRALEDALDTLVVVNTLLCRQWQREEGVHIKESIYKASTRLFRYHKQWNWTNYLARPIMFSFSDCPYVLFKEKSKEHVKVKKLEIDFKQYETLLQNTDIWNNGGDFNYQYRVEQEKVSLKIRENLEKGERIFIEAPTGSGKTFAYLLIVAIYTYINKQNKRYDDCNVIISTDTKELQNQLIDKDIPSILQKLGLNKKVRYGAIKGKANYLCMDRLGSCKEFEEEDNGLLSKFFLERLGQEGLYGDMENINYWAQNHFNIEKYKKHVTCDSEECNLDRCSKPCYLRNRYNELPQDNITVVNHSLLASWPYSEKRKIYHLILDEAHNLMEKSYDFFTEEFNSFEFKELLNDIENGTPSIIFLLNRLNGLNNYKETINRAVILEKTQEIIFNISNLLNEFRRLNLSNGEYNFNEEYYNADYKNEVALKSTVEPISELKRSIYNLYKQLDVHIRNIVSDDDNDGSKEYKALINYTAKLKGTFDIIDNFLEFSKEYAKVIEIHKSFEYFIIKNVPLNIGQLINDNILKEVKSTAFVSATLRINNSFESSKRILGQSGVNNFSIPTIFQLKSKTRIFSVKDMGAYNDGDKFINNSAKFIYDLSNKLNGHILVLFNNNQRRELVKVELEKLVKGSQIEVHTSKKAIPFLKDKNRQIIILGSKGFFEGIDVPGDSLNCVIIDKIPNVNPKEPLFKALKNYKNTQYYNYNYPKVCIRMKQGYGRLIRSIFDYGYFIILDGGENKSTLRALEIDLGGPRIEERWAKDILSTVEYDFQFWQKQNLSNILSSIPQLEIKDKFNVEAIKRNLFWEVDLRADSNEYVIFKYLNKAMKMRIE